MISGSTLSILLNNLLHPLVHYEYFQDVDVFHMGGRLYEHEYYGPLYYTEEAYSPERQINT